MRRLLLFIVMLFLSTAVNAKQGGRWYTGHIPDDPYNIPLVNKARIPAHLHRTEINNFRGAEAGIIIVDKSKKFLYFPQGDGRALRYGIGVGRAGAQWNGTALVGRKAKWPGWTPTANMRRQNPKLPRHVRGGPNNPLGARALYLYKDGRDTLFRIHGTNAPWSIGNAESAGCIRMLDEHIYDLYDRVPVGTKVVVRK